MEDYLRRLVDAVIAYENTYGKETTPLHDGEVLIVWFSKTLQNAKAMIITTRPDQRYYEITYNGDKRETYVDVYDKTQNICIKDIKKD